MIPGSVEKRVLATPFGQACVAQPTLYVSAQTTFMCRKQAIEKFYSLMFERVSVWLSIKQI